jgi:serine/threonine protein kinase
MGRVKFCYLNVAHCTCSTVLHFPKYSAQIFYVGYEPLSWTSRVQIALDSARGLEYIHEHTVPVYVHRDIKSANILIDRDLRAKVETIHEAFHVLAILCAITVVHLAGCRFWTDKTFRNWNYITVTPITTSCWYIWLHASRVSTQGINYLVPLFSSHECALSK